MVMRQNIISDLVTLEYIGVDKIIGLLLRWGGQRFRICPNIYKAKSEIFSKIFILSIHSVSTLRCLYIFIDK